MRVPRVGFSGHRHPEQHRHTDKKVVVYQKRWASGRVHVHPQSPAASSTERPECTRRRLPHRYHRRHHHHHHPHATFPLHPPRRPFPPHWHAWATPARGRRRAGTWLRRATAHSSCTARSDAARPLGRTRCSRRWGTASRHSTARTPTRAENSSTGCAFGDGRRAPTVCGARSCSTTLRVSRRTHARRLSPSSNRTTHVSCRSSSRAATCVTRRWPRDSKDSSRCDCLRRANTRAASGLRLITCGGAAGGRHGREAAGHATGRRARGQRRRRDRTCDGAREMAWLARFRKRDPGAPDRFVESTLRLRVTS